MRCPNCKCVVPERMEYCNYCGYEFSQGASKTLTIDEMYADRINSDYNRYGYYDNKNQYAYDSGYKEYHYETYNNDSVINDILLTLLAGSACVLILIILAMLVFLI